MDIQAALQRHRDGCLAVHVTGDGAGEPRRFTSTASVPSLDPPSASPCVAMQRHCCPMLLTVNECHGQQQVRSVRRVGNNLFCRP